MKILLIASALAVALAACASKTDWAGVAYGTKYIVEGEKR